MSFDDEANISIGSKEDDIITSAASDAMKASLGVVMNYDFKDCIMISLLLLIIYERINEKRCKTSRHPSRMRTTSRKSLQQGPISPQAYKTNALIWSPLPTTSPRRNMAKTKPMIGDNASFPLPAKSVPLTVTNKISSTQVPDYVTGTIRYYYRTLLAWHTTVHLGRRAAVGSGCGSRE